MTSFQKLALATALSLPTVALITPASAGQPRASRDIVVTASPRQVALADWASRVQTRLEDQMQIPQPVGPIHFADQGLAQVRFVCSETGRPDQVTLAQSSGNSRIDRAALGAVRRISLHPLPEGMKPDQKVLAQLLFLTAGTSDREAARRTKALQAKAAKHNEWFYRDEVASGEMLLLAAAK